VLFALQRAMHWSGAGWAYSRVGGGGGAIILMYHSVAGPDVSPFVDPRVHLSPRSFEAQVRFLSRRRRVIPLGELVDTLEKGRSPPRGSVVITFDDGYLDNLEIAAPILDEHELPATLYLATGYVEDGETQWVDRLYTMFATRTRDGVESSGNSDGAKDLSRPDERVAAYEELCQRLIVAPRADREAILDEVEEQLRPEAAPPRLTMTWEEVRRLVKEHPRFELGLHTADHEDLTARSPEEARDQVRRSMEDLEREAGVTARHFSFPYSRHSEETRQMVRELGVESAVASGTDYLVGEGSDPFALPRIDPPDSKALFRFWTGGAYPGLPMKLLGRS
jgi:peptidoglycan/xylan/chitin deacetylase (PgdA/CDA1 family)